MNRDIIIAVLAFGAVVAAGMFYMRSVQAAEQPRGNGYPIPAGFGLDLPGWDTLQ